MFGANWRKRGHPQRKVRAPRTCCIHGCEEKNFCYGRCRGHYFGLDPIAYERMKNMTRAERKIEIDRMIAEQAEVAAVRSRWEFLGDEASLIAAEEAKDTQAKGV